MKRRMMSVALCMVIIWVSIVACFAADPTQIQAKIDECENNKRIAHEMAECARTLGYAEDHIIIQTASARWWEEHRKQLSYQDEINKQNTYAVSKEYPVAAEVWNYLRYEMNLSEPVAAGIIGSFMEECGGQTLNLQWWTYGGNGIYSYYGLAMWSLLYCPQIAGADLETQLDFFASNLKQNIELFGGSYDYFTSLTDPQSVVWYYYQYYGRGYGCPSTQRLLNATTALNYFGTN